MIMLLLPDGSITDFSELYSDQPDFDWMQEVLNIPPGYLEFVTILDPETTLKNPRRANLVVHEEGQRLQLPFNEQASRLYWRVSIERDRISEEECRILFPILGPALFLTKRNCVK